jgi:hypothetical protein
VQGEAHLASFLPCHLASCINLGEGHRLAFIS